MPSTTNETIPRKTRSASQKIIRGCNGSVQCCLVAIARYAIGQAPNHLIPEDVPFDILNSRGTLQDASGAMQLLPLFANIKPLTPQDCDCINQK
jgi:hypothetical protein